VIKKFKDRSNAHERGHDIPDDEASKKLDDFNRMKEDET